jgi:hypothetical protein
LQSLFEWQAQAWAGGKAEQMKHKVQIVYCIPSRYKNWPMFSMPLLLEEEDTPHLLGIPCVEFKEYYFVL